MLQLLDKHNRIIKNLSARQLRVLSTRYPESIYADILKRFRAKQHRIQCQCGLILHVVFDPDTQSYFLRRNRGQDRVHDKQCPFYIEQQTIQLESSPYPQKKMQIHHRPFTESAYLLDIRKGDRIKKPGSRTDTESRRCGHSNIKYASLFAYLFNILENLGIHKYPNTVLNRNAKWDDVFDFLQGTPYGNFCWCPSKACAGGLAELNVKMLEKWNDSHREPEGIVLAIADEIPDRAFTINKFENDQYPLKGANIPRHQISVIGKTGPWLFLAACTPQPLGRNQSYAAPVFNRMAMHAIVSWRSLIPVDSNYERQVAKYLMYKMMDFEKPLFSEGPNVDLRPDFIVDRRYILEVQGMNSEDYIERKRRIHPKMEQYFNLPVATYEPQKQQIEDILCKGL